MAFMTRKTLITLSMLGGGALALAGGFIWSGLYNIGADDVHTRPVYAVLEMLRKRSIAVRATQLQPPDLSDPARIQQGAGNYSAMCTGCHLTPGMPDTELSRGLYPSPPNLTRTAVDGAEAFWVIKHGIKASGMPAWGKSMEDEYIWNMAAFLQVLPGLSMEQYEALVAASGGHSHGGGESKPHDDAMPGMDHHGGDADHDDTGAAPHDHGVAASPTHEDSTAAAHDPGTPETPASTTHVHTDGKTHVHDAPTSATPPAETPKAEHDDHH